MASAKKKFITPRNVLYMWLFLAIGVSILIFQFVKIPGIRPTPSATKSDVNKESCLTDECLDVENLTYPVEKMPSRVETALQDALLDEYKALTTYRAVTDTLGQVRPFSMIQGAEERHIAALTSVFQKYGIAIPDNPWLGNVTVPPTLQESCQLGVDAEVANVALYEERLLPVVKDYEDVTLVFTNLMTASKEKHLPAFDRCN